jgi:pimeloyl-ACP methyl ester carboxylesterase
VADPSTVVLVHGAWHGAWCWDKVVALLSAAGVPASAVELPLTSLADDVDATRAAIDAVGGPVVLCGHSYGGVVITEAGNHPAVVDLVYLCAFALEEGESAAATASDQHLPSTDLADALRISEDGVASIDLDGARAGFYLDCAPGDADAAVARLRPMSFSCFTDAVTTAAWRDRPSTYVVCGDDRAVHPDMQRFLAKRCTTSVEWATGHSPFVSHPELVADLLTGLAR